jgi:hypothetical protein
MVSRTESTIRLSLSRAQPITPLITPRVQGRMACSIMMAVGCQKVACHAVQQFAQR